MKKLLRKPYRVVINLAKKITDLDKVKSENESLRTEITSLRTEKYIINKKS